MKKLLALLLALVFCVAPLVSCGDDATETGTGTETTADAETGAYDVKSAAAFLKNMYKQYLTAPETTKDFTLVSQVMNDGVAYTVTWTTDNEAIKVIADEANKQVTIDVDEKTPEVVNYKLTATVADPAGATEKVEFALSVPACAFAPEEGTAYKFYLTQAIAGKVLYVDGGISGGRYLTMTDDFAKALDFFVEASGNGYKFFTTIDGAKKYVDIFTNDEGQTAVGYADSSDCVYTYNSATFAWEAEVDGVAYYLGTYKSFETVSASKTSYITVENTRVSQFPMEFTTEKVEYKAPETPDEPEDPNVIIGGTANADVFAAPKAGTAYKFYFYQSKVGKALYIDGGTNQDRYLTTTTDFAKALNVYVESANGGYKFYVTIDGAKKYIDVYKNEAGKDAIRYADTTNCTFKYNKETFAWEVAAGEETYYLGTYQNYETVSASKTSYINKDNTRKEQFPLELVTKAVTITPGSGNTTPSTPSIPSTPTTTPAADNGTYRLYLDQVKAKKILYLDGGVKDDRFLTMTDDYSKAITAKFEAVKGGYKIAVTINGAKKYIDVYKNEAGKDALRYADTTNCVFNENKDTKAWETVVDGTAFYLGTYNTFDTVSASKTSYITAENTGKDQFPLVKTTKEITPYPDEPETPSTPSTPSTPATAPIAGKAYKLEASNKDGVMYFTGVKSGKLTASATKADAVDIFVEVDGSTYYIYYMNAGAKTYISAEESGTSCFKTYADKATASGWTIDAATGAFISASNGRFIGGNKTATTVDMRGYASSNLNTADYSIAKFIAA
ncbi:MAG: hypothetical protein IKL21_04980 [Clostridia bacterium]|nr:hypothetical protein [Clostridia bacterium]